MYIWLELGTQLVDPMVQLTESERSALSQLDKFAKVCNEVLRRIERHQDDAATMALSAALLEQNPECYTVWTFRRRVLSEQMLVSWPQLSLVLAEPAGRHLCTYIRACSVLSVLS